MKDYLSKIASTGRLEHRVDERARFGGSYRTIGGFTTARLHTSGVRRGPEERMSLEVIARSTRADGSAVDGDKSTVGHMNPTPLVQLS